MKELKTASLGFKVAGLRLRLDVVCAQLRIRIRVLDDISTEFLLRHSIMSTVEQIIYVAVVMHVLALVYFVYSGLAGSHKQKDQ